MSSSAPQLTRAAEEELFCYTEAHIAGGVAGVSAEQSAEERSRRQQAEAFERGREATRQQLQASLDAAVCQGREQIRQALDQFARERAAYYRRVEGEVVQLALAIARKVIHREAQLDPHLLAGIVRVALEKLDAGSKVDLYVNVQQAADWRHFFACQTEGTPVPEVHEDPALSTGECHIETSLGSSEAGLELQLKEIETGLLDLLAERPRAPVSSAGPSASPAFSPASGASATEQRP